MESVTKKRKELEPIEQVRETFSQAEKYLKKNDWVNARKQLEEVARQSIDKETQIWSCVKLAKIHYFGQKVKKNMAKVAHYLARACEIALMSRYIAVQVYVISQLLSDREIKLENFPLEAGKHVDYRDAFIFHRDGNVSLLIWAVKKNYLHLAELLLEMCIDATKLNSINPSLLFNTDGKMMKLLLAKGAQVGALNAHGNTPLHEAQMRETVKILVSRGADVRARGNHGFTPLHAVVYHYNQSESYVRVPLSISDVRIQFLEVAQELLYRGAGVNDVDEDGWSPLHMAVTNADIDMVELLLAEGANVNLVAKDGSTPLHFACCKGVVGVVKLLLDKGASVDVVTKRGSTPLILAVESGYKEVVKLLLDTGAHVNAIDYRNETALSRACFLNSKSMVTLLLLKGADVSIGNQTALYHTVVNNWYMSSAELLGRENFFLTKGSRDVLKKRTAKAKAIATMLIAYGADINLPVHGKTLVETCLKNKEIVNFLDSKGARKAPGLIERIISCFTRRVVTDD